MIDEKIMKNFQIRAIDKWNLNSKKAVIVAPTGAGKTLIGLYAYQNSLPPAGNKCLIVVPTINLMRQWKQAAKTFFPNHPVVTVGDGTSLDDVELKIQNEISLNNQNVIVISVVNSIRFKSMKFDMCILDEFHRYLSRCNRSFLPISEFTYILGLSATYSQKNNESEIIRSLVVADSISYNDAYREGLICDFDVVNVAIELTTDEEMSYKTVTDRIKESMKKFNFSFGVMNTASRNGDIVAINGMRAIAKRKQILFDSPTKTNTILKLVTKHPDDKIIVFTETIENADVAYKTIRETGRECVIFHSEVPKDEKDKVIDAFKTTPKCVLVCVKALDEGLNVPDASIGIVAAGTSTERQFIQRLGRVIRKVDGKRATLYQIFFQNTKEEQWVRDRTIIDSTTIKIN